MMAQPDHTATEAAVLKVPTTVKSLIEALIFAAREPLTVKQIQVLYEIEAHDGDQRRIDQPEIVRIVEELNGEYHAADRPYRIVQIAGGYQFATVPIYAGWLGKLQKEQSRRKLSQSAIETLAIISYKQPITKPEVESIRGVNCDYVMKSLLEKELIAIVGRAATPGRPLLYGTTREFLKHFGLNEITDLPRPREIEEILGESQFETERRMLEAQHGLEQAKKEEEEFKSRLPHIPKRKPELDEEVKIVPKKRPKHLDVRKTEEAEEGAKSSPVEIPPIEVRSEPEVPTQSVGSEPESPTGPLEGPEEAHFAVPAVEDDSPALDIGRVQSDQVDFEPVPATSLSPELPPEREVLEEPVPEKRIVTSSEVSPPAEPEPKGLAQTSGAATSLPPEELSRDLQAKSRWQTWKKKIQGFLKKLFA